MSGGARAASSPSRVWGGAPDANEFSAFQTKKKEAFRAIICITGFCENI